MWAVALLVFREVLEAALIVSVVAAATRGVPGAACISAVASRWESFGALLVAWSAGLLAAAFSGVGQELFNAGVLLAAVLMIGWHVLWMSSHGRELSSADAGVGNAVTAAAVRVGCCWRWWPWRCCARGRKSCCFCTACVPAVPGHLWAGLTIGVTAGAHLGLALYAGLLRIPLRHFFRVTNAMLVLLAAGLASSAARYLIQANLLPAWASRCGTAPGCSATVRWLGQTAHILVGYDAQPAGMQLVFYAITLCALWAGAKLIRRCRQARRSADACHADAMH